MATHEYVVYFPSNEPLIVSAERVVSDSEDLAFYIGDELIAVARQWNAFVRVEEESA